MAKELFMGNHAMGVAAIDAGVSLVTGYPGTPSSEILETVARNNPGDIYVEWSVNEKAALEIAAGASYAGARTLVTMKQVGLNVAADPLLSLAYIGVKGGLVVIVADDPGPISSQTEQDTRTFAAFSKVPVFDPSTPEEAYSLLIEAFDFSEKYRTPVLFRPTTRVCHGCSAFERQARRPQNGPLFFEKSPNWVIFPKLSREAHAKIEVRNAALSAELSESGWNVVSGKAYVSVGEQIEVTNDKSKRLGIATGGISYAYVQEALDFLGLSEVKLLKVTTPFPFPKELAADFASDLDEILVVEELDPVIEKELLILCGQSHSPWSVRGKWTSDVPSFGELDRDQLLPILRSFLRLKDEVPEEDVAADAAVDAGPAPDAKPAVNAKEAPAAADALDLPARPPVLCAGCPHRASFYAVKQAMKGKRAIFTGDIGCYTLGNAPPLDMTDTCLCMGAGFTIAQGLKRAEPEATLFAFIGDSTFFASGLTGVANAVHTEAAVVHVILDNRTTAMTGNQPHPGMAKNMMGTLSPAISIEEALRGLGIEFLETCDPFDQEEAIRIAREAALFSAKGKPSAIIYKAPCIAVAPPEPTFVVEREACTACGRCIREIGCPAIHRNPVDRKAEIDETLCYGCTLCAGLCPTGAIKQVKVNATQVKAGATQVKAGATHG